MKSISLLAVCVASVLFVPADPACAEIKVVIQHRENDEADSRFRFKTVPRPSSHDAATEATFTIVEGEMDPNSGGLDALHNGSLPRDEDQPRENFFFNQGTDGGRIRIDLGRSLELKQVNTYSWHPGTRGPQVYRFFAADGKAAGFDAAPRRPADPEKFGWKTIASIDTRPKDGEPGGQYGVSIFDSGTNLGVYRYLLFDISRTEDNDPFGNTFYSEIDVVDANAPEKPDAASAELVTQKHIELIETDGYEISIDTSDTPDLTEWAHKEVAPMAKEWYPKLVKFLASDGFEAPKNVSIVFDSEMRGVAATGGSQVRCAAKWFRANLQGEALGAVFHELVHVVQHYGRSRPVEEGAKRPPGWLVEGIADYIRWFKFQPQDRGAEITRNNISRARYDGNYRITANFLNWTTETYDKDLVPRINAAIRQGKYRDVIWQARTGHALQELGAEWKAEMEKKVAEGDGKGSNPQVQGQ